MLNEEELLKELRGVDQTAAVRTACGTVPGRKDIIEILLNLKELLFPCYFRLENVLRDPAALLTLTRESLKKQIYNAYSFVGRPISEEKASEITDTFFSRLPYVKEMLLKDVEALYNGDPAANCREEILISYPGFLAIMIYRLAHEIYLLKIPFIFRIMTEYAHEKTGIDIHAGATIGEYFFIDHGTGTVIGETTVIGDHVKLYQGVTLGAKSFETDPDGNPVKGIKRHPNIGNHVVIYANATILGGNTYIGDGCVIGGNVWLTRSVETGKIVTYQTNGERKNE